MRLSQLAGKEIINLSDGARLGVINESQLLIDVESGKIDSIILPRKRSFKISSTGSDSLVIPWSSVRKVGEDLLIVELPEDVARVEKTPEKIRRKERSSIS